MNKDEQLLSNNAGVVTDLIVRGFLEVEHQVRRWEMEERCQSVSSMEYVAHIVTETRKEIAALAALERHDAST